MIALRTLPALLLLAAPALAEGEFSEGSEAKPWHVIGEEPARFTGEVVDIICDLTGDCPENCGNGGRQLGILREADGQLILAAKNSQPLFTGAARELYPFCGQMVEVDGNLVGDPEGLGTSKFYQIQRIRALGNGDWTAANNWTKEWAAANPDAAKADGPWFRNDPQVNALIAEHGYLGLGQAVDDAFIADWFE
ncbi:hypothetical protein [Algicella marina]|uniref:Uncharacterized protein n=1 Tax=Algicella marina TaxID=2683284 RepID=A0A6P1T2K3_9RHOB|nr:hypothetical protein [Algicella marina]QHQ34742.1 hypothetical protein GO499_05810 [Algicella marina]